jgi:hypothetical protein
MLSLAHAVAELLVRHCIHPNYDAVGQLSTPDIDVAT